MKSANYSAKGAFSGVFRSVVRRQLPGAIVAAAVCALASVIYSLYAGISCYSGESYITYEVQMWGISVLFFISVYCAVSIGVMYNAYFNRRGCDYQLALPYKRSHIFNANFLFGLIAICFSIIVSVALFAFILGIFTDIRAQDHVSFMVDNVIYKQAVTLISALLAGYSMCSMCAAISGKWLQYAAFSLVGIVSVPIMLVGIAMGINSVWGVMIDIYKFSSITPFGVLVMLFRDTTDSSFIFMTAVCLAEFILMYIAGLLAFKRRKAEIAESGYGDSVIKYILMVVFVVSGFLYFGIQKNLFATLIIDVILAFVCAFAFSMMQIRRKKVFTKKSGIVFGVTTAVCIVFVFSIYFSNSSSFVKYVPKAEEVESVTIIERDDYSLYKNDPLWYVVGVLYGPVSETNRAVLTEPQNIQAVIDFHNLVVSDEVMNYTQHDRDVEFNAVTEAITLSSVNTEETVTESDDEEINSSLSFDLEYKLKDGRTIKRSYIIQYNLWDEYLNIMKSREAITQHEPYSLSADDIMYVETIVYSINETDDTETTVDDKYYVTPPEKWEEMRDILVQDKMNETNSEFYYDILNGGYMTVYVLADELPQEQKDYIRNMTPFERRDYAGNASSLMLRDPDKYPVYPFVEYNIIIRVQDERTIQYFESEDMQQYIVE